MVELDAQALAARAGDAARDALERGLHDFLARHLLEVYGAGQINGGGIRVDHGVLFSVLFVL